MTATSFWSTVEYNRNHYGNAYVWIQGAGKNMKLWILPSEQVEVWYDDAKALADQEDIYYFYSAGVSVRFSTGFPSAGTISGNSPIAFLRLSLFTNLIER